MRLSVLHLPVIFRFPAQIAAAVPIRCECPVVPDSRHPSEVNQSLFPVALRAKQLAFFKLLREPYFGVRGHLSHIPQLAIALNVIKLQLIYRPTLAALPTQKTQRERFSIIKPALHVDPHVLVMLLSRFWHT